MVGQGGVRAGDHMSTPCESVWHRGGSACTEQRYRTAAAVLQCIFCTCQPSVRCLTRKLVSCRGASVGQGA